MRALVTGATGFIGSHLVDALLKSGIGVKALVRKTSNLRWLKGLKLELIFGELSTGSLPSGLLQDVDYVFHVGGVIDALSRADYFRTHVDGTRCLAQIAARSSKLKKFILVSSQAAGGPSSKAGGVKESDPPHPVSHYGQSKLASEQAALRYANQFPLVILRPPTVYGPRDTRVFTAFKMMKRGFAIALAARLKQVSLCYIDDLIKAILLAAFQPQASGRIYNVAGGRPYDWLEFIEAIHAALKRPYRLIKIPEPALFLFGVVGEVYMRLTRRPAIFRWQTVKEFLKNSWVIDGSRIREELGWKEGTSLSEGIAKTAVWYQEAGWL